MAKNRASRKPRGTDSSGQPIDLGSNYRNQVSAEEYNRWVRSQDIDLSTGAINRKDTRVAAANMRDMTKNPPWNKTVALPKADSLAGRTVEAGTSSMLKGLRSWITGGGGSILRGR